MTQILLRIQHPKGQCRIEIDTESVFQDLYKLISEKTSITETNILLSLDGKRYTLYSPQSKIQNYRDFEDGAKIFVRTHKEEKEEIKEEKEESFAKVQSKCNHGPNGRCLNCNTIQEKVQNEKNEKEVFQKSKCNHGPNGKCLNCQGQEEQDKEKYVTKKVTGKCDHGPHAKCLHCVSQQDDNIKHLSFDQFIDKNYSKCNSHSPYQKCNNCLVDLEFDYKIKKDCTNHEPYPQGMCSKCLPPLIKMKRQAYRHVDYSQFMNINETQNFIQNWLKNLNQRVGFVYGYYAEDPIYTKGVRAIVETIYEPPQENQFNESLIMQDPFQTNLDSIIVNLGLERIGWIFTTFSQDTFLSSQEIMQAGRFQEEYKITHPVGIDVSKHITIVLRADNNNNNEVKPEVYMVSDECQSLIRDDLIKEGDTRKLLKIKKPEQQKNFSTKFLYNGKIVEEIEPDFFIVNVAHGQSKNEQFNIMNGNYFQPANRGVIQRPSMVAEYLNQHKRQPSYKKYANLHLLLYLSKLIDIHTVLTICEHIKLQTEIPDYLEDMIIGYAERGQIIIQQLIMGIQTSKESFDGMQNYSVTSTQNLESLGELLHCRDIHNQQRVLVLKTNYAIPQPQRVLSEVQSLEKLKEIPYLSRLIKFDTFKDQMLCYDNNSLLLVFEDFEFSFETEQQITQEGDLWQIIEDLLNFLYDLNNLGYHHGDLQPKYIKFTNNRIVRIHMPLKYTIFKDAYNYRLANDNYKSTYSPEQLEFYNYREQNVTCNKEKIDTYSLGICILSFVTKKDFTSFYDFIDNQIKEEMIKSEINDLKQKGYSKKLRSFLTACLRESAQKRADLNELFKIHQNKSLNSLNSNNFW